MSDRFSKADLNGQIYAEASDWFVEMRAGDVDAAGRQRFDAWIRKATAGEPASSNAAALASALRMPQTPDVLGLFPEPGTPP